MFVSRRFKCPANKLLGSYGPIRIVEDAKVEESGWQDYSVYWTRELTAIPASDSRDQLRAELRWGPLINAPTRETGQVANCALRPDRKNTGINGWSTRAIDGSKVPAHCTAKTHGVELCLAYGVGFASRLRKERETAHRRATQQKRALKKKREGVPSNCIYECKRCGAVYALKDKGKHFKYECPKRQQVTRNATVDPVLCNENSSKKS